MNNTKARSEAIQEEAMEMVYTANIDLTRQVNPNWVREQLVKVLEDKMECHRSTARNHIYKAMRRQRDPDWQPPQWGGTRSGAGKGDSQKKYTD